MPQLGLGTVQFGLDYGISNTHGKTSSKESLAILEFAELHGISLLDTASGYGNSEKLLGSIFSLKEENIFKVVTKIQSCEKNKIKSYLKQSLQNLKLSSIYGLLFHDFKSLSDDFSKWNILEEIKTEGSVRKIGVSLYHPEEWRILLSKNIIPDIVQIPFNIFDQRFLPVLGELKERKVEVHVRSVFLQGLFFMDLESLPSFFSPVKENLKQLQKMSFNKGIPVSAMCLNFAYSFSHIDYIVIGVDSLEHLKENLKLLIEDEKELELIKKELMKINIKNERMVLPYLWPKKF